jgi:DNA modification methylase
MRFTNGEKYCRFQNQHDSARSLFSLLYRHNQPDAQYHSQAKPKEVFELFIKYWSKENDTILDMFLGSGNTMIAAELTKRKCIGYEIIPEQCAIILERMSQFHEPKKHDFNFERHVKC